MTILFEKAADKTKQLPDVTQDLIAKYLLTLLDLEELAEATEEADILKIIQDELMWNVQFSRSTNLLEKLAEKALNEHAQGKTVLLDIDDKN
ncbi:MAG: hypothetical protein KJ043_20335 [Anaerolineae bacterium]|nr:hypothetical protein [Anaerolineae bacterium]